MWTKLEGYYGNIKDTVDKKIIECIILNIEMWE